MFNFSGCKCPVCQQPFTENDDIVVCPECGAPYHRSCYQEHHGCVFADRHAPGFEWKPSPTEAAAATEETGAPQTEQAKEFPCPSCGAMNPESALFCETCGAPMRRTAPGYNPANENGHNPAAYGPGSVPQQDPFFIAGLPPEVQVRPEDEMDGIKARDWAAYLGDNAAWYLLNFKQMCATGRKLAISFSAFFFGPFYFLYRKMWGPAAALIGAKLVLFLPNLMQMLIWSENPIAASFSPQLVNVLLAVSSTISLILQFACGCFSVYLYRRLSAKRLKKLLANGPVDAAVLRKAGGTSKTALVISILVLIAISYLVTFLLLWPAITSGGALL